MIGFYNYTVIPTYLSVVSSVIGSYFALNGKIGTAMLCLLISGLCDMFDGKIASTKDRSEAEKKFGIQIDSLCDLFSFGLFPAVIGYKLGMDKLYYFAVYAAYILAAVIRLAYFNVMEEERQSKTSERRREYEGLPVTSVALIFPLAFSILRIANVGPRAVAAVYTGLMIFIALAFVSKIRVPKPGIRGMIIMGLFGIAEFILLIISAF